MRELSLFSGCGMGVFGTWLDTVLYCEIEPYRRKVLRARMRDGLIATAPIATDVRQLTAQDVPAVDIVTGGYPCQAFSTAALGRHTAIDLWPEMHRLVVAIRPAHVFAENVLPAPILKSCRDLQALGYACQYARVDANAFGAPHRRARWWVVAHADPDSKPELPQYAKTPGVRTPTGSDWWADGTWPLRVDDGGPARLERLGALTKRLEALGDGQVPSVARYALEYLW